MGELGQSGGYGHEYAVFSVWVGGFGLVLVVFGAWGGGLSGIW